MTDVKRHILRTASEIAMGRYMRAPDHPSATGEGPAAAAAAEPGSTADAGADDAEDFAAFERRTKGAEEPKGADEPGADDGDPDDGDGDELEPEAEEPSQRRGKTAKERIAEITRRAHEKEREAEYWRGVAEGTVKRQPEQPKDDAATAAEDDAEPNADDYEYGEADPKYLVDVAKHTVRKEMAEARQREVIESNLQRVEQDWQSKAATAKEKYPDFDDRVIAAAAKGEWPCSQIVSLGIKTSEVGADIAYHLATNVEEAKRIDALSPIEQARELGKLEGRFAQDPAPQRKIATDAPEPPPARARGAGGQFAVDDDTTDFAAFEAKHGSKARRRS